MIRMLSSPPTASRLAPVVRRSRHLAGAQSQARYFFFNKKGKDDDEPTKSSDSSSSKSSLTPSQVGFGDNAPRYPHLTGLPVISRPLFPGSVQSVTLSDQNTIDALENLTSNNSNGYCGVFLRKKHPTGVTEGGVIIDKPEIITDASDLYSVGTFAQISRLTRGVANPKALIERDNEEDHTSASLLLVAHRRIDLVSVDDIGPPIDLTVKHWDRVNYTGSDDTIRALSNEILSTIREVAQLNPLFRESVQFFPMRVDANDPFRLADFAASITSGTNPEDLQAVLEEHDPEKRLNLALILLSKEREVSKLQQEISAKVEEKMTEAQRKYFLTEQLKSIKKELGMERDDKEALIEKYRKQLSEYTEVPAEVMETIESELEKLSTLEKNSAEFNVTRSYLDWLTSVPWGVTTEENFDIRDARRILDRDHYGLDEVKDTILQFIAVGKLRGSVQGKILCLAGPPGTGKTSIAESIANALGRKFFRFSVGGLSDVSEIKGHRRTYIGSMPGKIIQCLKSTGSSNPLVLIDEIDKLGSGFRGDPASALLEVLDPSQNSTFRDHFLDVPVDISKVLFMCTANDLDRIPGPLLDRMEVIRLSGYDFPEKVAIAEQYLVPKSMRESGLMVLKEDLKDEIDDGTSDEKNEQPKTGDEVGTPLDRYEHAKGIPETLSIAKSAIESLVRWYCREAGVRSLAKYIDKISRKLALQFVAEDEGAELTTKSTRKSETWQVTENNLSDYVGKQIWTHDRLYDKDPLPHGVVMGLAWTSMGGSALYIETQGIKRGLDPEGKRRGGGTLKVTGQLGDVMKESSQIAYTVARARLGVFEPDNVFFDEMDIHAHVPEGATPKDGPSAGVTMVTSMLSLAMDKPVQNDLAMTGEISLTGKVLAVGGIKEKIMAARRAGIKCIVMPAANQRDYDEIPEYLKDGLDVHFAEDYQNVFDVAFGMPTQS
jgi:Lon-like ATP-dependent protease